MSNLLKANKTLAKIRGFKETNVLLIIIALIVIVSIIEP